MDDHLTRNVWHRLSAQEREAEARRLAKSLPTGFAFRSLMRYRLGSVEHEIAEYTLGTSTFVLLPGGEFELGYDAARPWEPTPEEQQSWQETAEEYEIDRCILEHITAVTLRPRQVRIPPLLVETRASEVGWQSLSTDDPEVRAIVQQNLRGTRAGEVQVYQGGTSLRVSRDEEGLIRAERAQGETHAVLAARLSESGFRFPTSDEWEYACGAEAPTLFRWGDHAPCDRYPIDGDLDEGWLGEEAVSSHEAHTGAFPSNWNLHVRPNAFGIYIARNPYYYELVAEPHITRGGDGGSMICGGAGFFIGWLTLATAYFDAELCEQDPEEPIAGGYTVGRRVLPLS